MDRLLFGDNQFLGVNHQDPTKAALNLEQFAKASAIIDVLGFAYDSGIRSFVFTVHPRYQIVFAEICRSNLFPELKLYPCVPYAHKYNDLLSSRSAASVFLDQVRSLPARSWARMANSAFRLDIWKIIGIFMEMELLSARLPRLDGLFLQNIATDMTLGLGRADGLKRLHEYFSESFNIELGYMTMNHHLLVESLRGVGLDDPIICSCINKAGYRMNPSQQIVEATVNASISRNVAMSVMASGAIAPDEAIHYINGLSGISSILFGSSKKENIKFFVQRATCPNTPPSKI